jgi:flagellar hook-associated protein 2
MGGISSSVGMSSRIDSASRLIEQLLAVEARPKQLAQSRMPQIQTQQAAYLDIASRITAIKNSAAGFRLNNTFQSKSATSSNDDVLKATCGRVGGAGRGHLSGGPTGLDAAGAAVAASRTRTCRGWA